MMPTAKTRLPNTQPCRQPGAKPVLQEGDAARSVSADRLLLACAAGLLVLLGILLTPIINQPARAEMVSQTGHLVTMTAQGGTGDILLVLDNRSERLMVYKINAQNTMDLLENIELPTLFESARAKRRGK